MRADASMNRERVLTAARQVFAEQGLDVPMTVIARRAGVGIATLYRRFPGREDLIAAVFEDRMDAYAAAVARALEDPDPWHGFCGYVETVCGMQAEDRGFADLLTVTFPPAKGLEAKRDAAFVQFTELIARAQQAGGLRPDFSPEDLVLVLMANAGLVAATREAAPDAWRRLVGYLIQAFAARNTGELPPAPPPTAVYRAMVRLSRGASDR